MSGLLALLDDIATLAKLTMSTLDDTAAMAVKTSAKVSAAAVDDVAATPQYVTGITAEREIPVIRRIARGSLRNKLLIILPAGLLLSWLVPAVLPVALVLGGSYLCLEGGEKVWEKLTSRRHRADPLPAGATGEEDAPGEAVSEDLIVSRAVRTDFVLSTEIMLLALAEVHAASSLQRVVTLVMIAILLTFVVYGLVAALIKVDDAGVRLARTARSASLRRLGAGVVRLAPWLLRALGVIGTVAMLWVGGQIVTHNLASLGAQAPHHLVEHVTDVVAGGGHGGAVGPVAWLVETACHCLIGLLLGLALTLLLHGCHRVWSRLRGARRAS